MLRATYPRFWLGGRHRALTGHDWQVLLVGHVLIGAVPPLQRAAAEHFALRTDQMVPPVDEIPLGNHAALLVGVDGYVGCDALFHQGVL